MASTSLATAIHNSVPRLTRANGREWLWKLRSVLQAGGLFNATIRLRLIPTRSSWLIEGDSFLTKTKTEVTVTIQGAASVREASTSSSITNDNSPTESGEAVDVFGGASNGREMMLSVRILRRSRVEGIQLLLLRYLM